MRQSGSSPSIVPHIDQDIYLVGTILAGWAACEADVEDAGFETIVTDLLAGQYGNPIGGLRLQPRRGLVARCLDVAQELRRRCGVEGREFPDSVRDFVERHDGGDPRQLALRLSVRD